MEKWKEVKGYNGWYDVSNKGRIRSWRNNRWGRANKPKFLGLHDDGHGYRICILSINGKGNKEKVHRLVAKAFISNPKDKRVVNHKNGIKDDNRVENLEWVTKLENERHAARNGLTYSKLTIDEVVEIKKLIRKNLTAPKIAERYDVCSSTIKEIRRGTTWTHVKID